MTKVRINPGVCGFKSLVTATADEEQEEVTLKVASGCESIQKMMQELGDTFDAFETCLVKPGEGPFFEYAKEHFPVHAACPVISGILKCIEAECHLALPRDVSITFEE